MLHDQLQHAIPCIYMGLAADGKMTLREKLEEKRKDGKISQAKIGAALGIEQATVSLYENNTRRLKARGPEFVQQFFRGYGFTEAEVMELSRELFREDWQEISQLQFGSPGTDEGPKAPHYGEISAGLKGAAERDMPVRYVIIPDYIANRYGTESIFVLEAKGDSMACDMVREDIPEGTECYFHSNLRPENGDVVAVWLELNSIGVLKIYRPEPDFVVLQSYNRGRRPIIIDQNNPGELRGVLVGISRGWGRFKNGR